MHFMSVFTLYSQNGRISMNYDEMRGKQGANLLNHVATLVGQDEFCFFLLLLNKGYTVLRYCGDVKGPISCNSWD